MPTPCYQPRNLLVTGGAGFIGANFIRYVLNLHQGINIINLDCLTYAGSLANLADLPDPDRHHFIKGNITDRALVNEVLREYTIDTLINFAAESHVDRSITTPSDFIQTNIVGTFTLLAAVRDFWLQEQRLTAAECRFHQVSTDEVYGSLTPSAAAFSETTRYDPSSPYSASKASADHLVRAYAHTYGLPTLLHQCSNNYGPYQHPEKFIPTIIHSCLNWRPIPLYGDGSPIRDWLYVGDHCAAIYTILTRGAVNQSYHVGGRNEWPNLAVARYICQQFDRLRPRNQPYETLIAHVADRPGHDQRYAIDCSKIERELGWQAQETFASGIQKTIDFYLKGTRYE